MSTATRPHLLLFTETFPLGFGEAFLEQEIAYLAASFERVVVIPRWLRPDRRSVPSNVLVDTSLARLHEARSISRTLVRCLMSRQFYHELMARPRTLLQAEAFDRLIGHLAAARRVATWLEGFTQAYGISLGHAVCYSYWLWEEAAGLGLARWRHPEMMIVSRAHGYDLYAERWNPAYIPMQRFALESADAVFAVSSHGAGYLRTKHPSAAHRIRQARLGVHDPGVLAASSASGSLCVLTCSRIVDVKRLDLAVRGIAVFARKHPRLAVEWTHFGDGNCRALVQATAERELPRSVIWSLRGECANREVLEYYRHQPVDVLLNVSASEGLPVSMMEAQSFSVPVIGTAVGGVPEIVGNENGVLLSPDPTPEEIAAALSQFVENPSVVAARRVRSRARWQADFDAAANLARFVATLRALSDTSESGLKLSPQRPQPVVGILCSAEAELMRGESNSREPGPFT